MTEFLSALRWLFGIERRHDTKPTPETRPSPQRSGKWVTSPTGGWQWVDDPRRTATGTVIFR
jgi:hypothetical protein